MKYGRSILADVEGYVPGEQPRQADVVKLNTNENPYPPSPKVLETMHAVQGDALRKYPDPLSVELRAACAERYGYESPDWVIAGNGMDEILAMTVRTFADPGDTLLTTYPTYTLYETLAQLHGATLSSIDLDDGFQVTADLWTPPGRIVFLARPNAPSGVACPRDTVDRLCSEFDGIVFVDEAYVDFADDNCLGFPKRFDNVIVGRTFSKSFSLAGLRVGLGFANPDIVREFLKTKDSYNMNAASQTAALAAVQDYEWMQANVAKVRATRKRLTQALAGLRFSVPPSQANFVLAVWDGTPTAHKIFEQLRDRGIYVRYFNQRRLENALRITVGTEQETDALLAALEQILG